MNLTFLFALVFAFFALASPVEAQQLKALHRHVPSAVNRITPLRALQPDQPLELAIALPLRNSTTLSNLIQSIYEPGNASYRRYLTPAEFTARFGPSAQDYEAVQKFAKQHGFTITSTHPNRMLLDVKAPASAIEKAFHLKMQVYQHPKEARMFFAPDSDPLVEAALPILSISGLDNYELPRPASLVRKLEPWQAFSQPYTTGSGPLGYLLGSDFRNAYMPGVQLDGTGEAVGIFSMDGYFRNDVLAYEALAGLPNVPITNVLLNGFSGAAGSHNDEAVLDITMAISMAPGLSKVVVYEGTVPNDILNAMANDNQARQLSCSWGFYPAVDPARDQIFQQFAAQGQTFFQASGDNGAWTQGVFPPSDNPYVTVVGGTSLETTTPGGPWASETVWPGSGGGFSTNYAIPPWQQGLNMATNQGSTTMRNIPDVSAVADSFFWTIAFNGEFFVTSGTSASTPLWAGLCALANQRAAQSAQPPVGFINPALYAIGKSAAYPLSFHDITSGNNTNSSSTNRFFAKPGYDLCTGWGTPAGNNLLSGLSSPPSTLLVTSAAPLFVTGPVGGPFSPASQTCAVADYSTVPVTWSLVQTSSWLKATPLSGILSPTSGDATVIFSLGSAASNLPPGTYSSTLAFNNSSDYSSQFRQFVLAVVTPPAITSQPTNQQGFEGMPLTFSAAAGTNAFIGWQWRFDNGGSSTELVDDGNIVGSATPTLTINSISSSNVGSYSVIATNAAGIAVSSNAFLSILPWRPIVTSQPTNQTVLPGQTAVLHVGAAGSQPLTFRWQLNGSNIFDGPGLSGAGTSTLTISNASAANAGIYSVAISNALGTVTSTGATVSAAPLVSSSSAITTLYTFSGGADGSEPNELLPITTGEFIGTTRHSGTNSGGTVFRVGYSGPLAGTLTTLRSFSGATDGANPFAPLRSGPDGNFYGTAFQGGSLGNGTIYRTTSNGVLSTVVTLNGNIGDFPYSPLTLGQDGNFYGTTYKGAAAFGTAFRLATNGTMTTLHVFNGGADGSLPYAGLTQGPDGKLYGTTYKGGAFGYGSIFALTTNGAFNTLFSFNNTNGAYVYGGLLLASDGNLYGVTSAGGASGNGTLFRLSMAGQFTSLYSFSGGSDGRGPEATLMQAADGNIYGSTTYGGFKDAGTIFRFAPGSSPVTLMQFDAFNGANPDTALVQGSSGGLFGTTANGGKNNHGLIFRLDYTALPPQMTSQPQSQSVFAGSDVLLSPSVIGSDPLYFQWRKDGTNLADAANVSGANARVLIISNATTLNAGTYSLLLSNPLGFVVSADAVLQVTSSPPFIVSQPTSQTLPPGGFASFVVSALGNSPLSYQWQKDSTNVLDGGNVAGATTGTLNLSSVIEANGGAYRLVITNALGSVTSSPAVLNVVPPSIAGTRFATLYSFSGTADGANANALTVATNGALYGTTQTGGANGGGTAFKLTTNGVLTTLAQLSGSTGANPKSPLALGTDGNLYGAAAGGGNSGLGTLFRLSTDGTISNWYAFSGVLDGSHPVAGLVAAPDGSLYGAAQDGGSAGFGTVFRATPSGAFTNLHSFTNGADGAHPGFALVRSKTGTFYGITAAGANGLGNVFTVLPSDAFANFYTFVDSGDGATPVGPLFQGLDGSVFGATRNYKLSGYELPGGIFRMSTNRGIGSMYVLNAFTHDGLAPAAGVIEGSDGNLYGTTEFGGVSGNGVVFRLTPGGGYSTLYEFDGFNSGAHPQTPVVEGPDGALYGSTSTGGPGGQGTVFKLTMTAAPQITLQPAAQAAVAGSTVSFAAAAFGSPALGFHWLKNGTNLNDAGNVSGALTRILTLTNISIANTGTYSVVITNAQGAVTSSVAALKILIPPVIQSVIRNGGNFILTYSTVPGQRYRVQSNTSLTNQIWTSLGLPTTASGTTLTYSDPVGVSTQKFYRVLLFPN